MSPYPIEAIVRDRSEALVRTLLESVRIASVSLTGEGIADQVTFLRKRLEGWGFAVEVHATSSHPIIYAETGPREARFTWLLYGHYDVYPADEKPEGWRTQPFEPVIEGESPMGSRHRRQQRPAPGDALGDRTVARSPRRAADSGQGDPRRRRGDGQRSVALFHRG